LLGARGGAEGVELDGGGAADLGVGALHGVHGFAQALDGVDRGVGVGRVLEDGLDHDQAVDDARFAALVGGDRGFGDAVDVGGLDDRVGLVGLGDDHGRGAGAAGEVLG